MSDDKRNDNGPRKPRDWLDEWQRSEKALDKLSEARRRGWPGWIREQAGKAQYSAWLVLPCSAADYGLRPLAAGTPYWVTPFIWVDSPDPSGAPLAGAENFLMAQVFNLGAATAAPTMVDFYWADPSVGLGAADAHHIGTEVIEVQPMSTRVVRCATPWVPSFLNGGHECVFVSCDNHVLDPLLLPFQPWAERHVGQRNLAVLPALAQAFRLWLPSGMAGVRSTLHVTALRGVMRLSGKDPGPAVRLLGEAASWLLAALRPAQSQVRRGEGQLVPPPVYAHLIAAQEVIAAVRLTGRENDAPKGGAPAPCGQMPAQDAGLGEPLFQVDGSNGVRREIELQLRAQELGMDELIVLNIVHVAAGAITGGYVLVMAHPGWFKDSPLLQEQDATMKPDKQDKRDTALQALVIEQYPQAKLTLELARALHAQLPITSADELRQAAKYMNIGGHQMGAGVVERFGLEELLPIRDPEDLVRKIRGVLTVALNQQPRGTTVNDPGDRLAAELGGKVGTSIPSYHFAGGALFGSTPAQGE